MKKFFSIFVNFIFFTLLFVPITFVQAFIKCTYQGNEYVFACNHDGNPDPGKGKDNMWTKADCDQKGCRPPPCLTKYCQSAPDDWCQRYYPVSEGGSTKVKMINKVMPSSEFKDATNCQLHPKL